MALIPRSHRNSLLTALRLFALMMVLAGCGPSGATAVASPTATAPVMPTATRIASPTPSEIPSETSEPSPSSTPRPPVTAAVPPTEIPSPTIMPEGLTLVPDVTGMPYREAREVMLESGFSLIYRDVLDLESPTGSVLAQEPAAGFAWKTGGIVTLFRSFAPPPMWISDKCYPLTIISRSGRLLFYVSLEQDRPYEIRTDFSYGRTGIYDYQMNELKSFSNPDADSMLFEPDRSGDYVLALGPFEVSQGALDNHPGGISAGCLYVSLPEE